MMIIVLVMVMMMGFVFFINLKFLNDLHFYKVFFYEHLALSFSTHLFSFKSDLRGSYLYFRFSDVEL